MQPRSGFTLIELMITVALLGVLLAVALPAYTGHRQAAQRREAAATLLRAQVFMEQYRSVWNRYPLATEATTALPAALRQVPASGTAVYTLTVTPTASTYTLTATPVGTMKDDACGALTLDHLGQRTATPTAGHEASSSGCWP